METLLPYALPRIQKKVGFGPRRLKDDPMRSFHCYCHCCRLALCLLALLSGAVSAQAQTTTLDRFVSASAGGDVDTARAMLAADPGLIAAAAASDRAVLYDALNARSTSARKSRRATVALLLTKGRTQPQRPETGRHAADRRRAECRCGHGRPAAGQRGRPQRADLRGVTPWRMRWRTINEIALQLIGKGDRSQCAGCAWVDAAPCRRARPARTMPGHAGADGSGRRCQCPRTGGLATLSARRLGGGQFGLRAGLTPLHVAPRRTR